MATSLGSLDGGGRIAASASSLVLSQQARRGANKKILLAGLIAIVAMAVLMVTAFRANTLNVWTTTQLMQQGNAAIGQQVRVEAAVIGRVSQTQTMQALFSMTDGKTTVPVTYADGLPDGFRDGTKISVQGALGPNGVFAAAQLTAKCPTKYQPVPGTGQ